MNVKEIINNNLLKTGSELIEVLDLKIKSYKREWLEAFLVVFSTFLWAFLTKEKRMTLAIMNDGILFIDVEDWLKINHYQKIKWDDLSKFNFRITKKKLALSSYCKYNIYFEINQKEYKSNDYFIIKDTKNRLSRERNLISPISNETYELLAKQNTNSKP